MNPTLEHREAQTAKGIAIIKAENADIGKTVLWMGGMDIGPILDEAVERERVRASVDFARRIMDLQRIIAKQKEEITDLRKGINKCHEREILDGEKIQIGVRAIRAVTGLLSSCGIEGDMTEGLKTLSTRYHAMMLGVTPENDDDAQGH